MLILTRHENQGIWINDDIFIKILKIVQYYPESPFQVKLGFEAPSSVEIHREEIYQRIQKEKETNRIKLQKKLHDDIYNVHE